MSGCTLSLLSIFFFTYFNSEVGKFHRKYTFTLGKSFGTIKAVFYISGSNISILFKIGKRRIG